MARSQSQDNIQRMSPSKFSYFLLIQPDPRKQKPQKTRWHSKYWVPHNTTRKYTYTIHRIHTLILCNRQCNLYTIHTLMISHFPSLKSDQSIRRMYRFSETWKIRTIRNRWIDNRLHIDWFLHQFGEVKTRNKFWTQIYGWKKVVKCDV